MIACPCCGSIAVNRRGKAAACMNPRCPDNGNIKPVQVFRQDVARVALDERKVAVGGGSRWVVPAFYDELYG
jgi:hypothetical protein